jgi:hypothetical protein
VEDGIGKDEVDPEEGSGTKEAVKMLLDNEVN